MEAALARCVIVADDPTVSVGVEIVCVVALLRGQGESCSEIFRFVHGTGDLFIHREAEGGNQVAESGGVLLDFLSGKKSYQCTDSILPRVCADPEKFFDSRVWTVAHGASHRDPEGKCCEDANTDKDQLESGIKGCLTRRRHFGFLCRLLAFGPNDRCLKRVPEALHDHREQPGGKAVRDLHHSFFLMFGLSSLSFIHFYHPLLQSFQSARN